MGDWKITTLGEVASFQRGHDLPDTFRIRGCIPVMGSFGITGWHNESRVNGPGVTVGRSGSSIGVVSFIDRDYWPLNTCLFVTDFHGNNPKFVYYLLKTIDLAAHNSGSAQPSLNRNFIQPLPVSIPDRQEQNNIATLLAALDDKIDQNRRMNEALETMARLFFKDWFVDFGPTRAKIEGRPPYLSPELWSLFPEALDDDDKPVGWKIENIRSLCSFVSNGGTPSRPQKEYWDNGTIPWYKTGELGDGFLIDSSERITKLALKESSVKLLPAGSVLMAIYAAPTVGRLGILTEESTFNQACTGMVPKANVGTFFLYLALYFGRDWFNGRANGAAQQNISKSIVENYELVVPNEPVLTAFNGVTHSLYEVLLNNKLESRTLIQTRDLLLPKLMSGEIRLRDAEKLVEQVA